MSRASDSNVWIAPEQDAQSAARTPHKRKPLVVRVADQIIVFPPGEFGPPRCVAVGTKRGSRCTAEVAGGYHGFSEWPILGYGGSISALEHGETDEAYLRQRCRRHLESNAPDYTAPEWERFDPERHPDAICLHRSFWTPDGLRTLQDETMGDEDAPTSDAAGTFREILAEAERRRDERRLTESVETALYSYYDADDVSLYIGITDDLRARTLAHVEASSWMDFAARCTITRHPSRKAALDAEREAIKAERPLFNHMHNATPKARARLVAYLVQHDRLDLLAPAVSRG